MIFVVYLLVLEGNTNVYTLLPLSPLAREKRVITRMSLLVDATRAKTDNDRLKKLIAASKLFDHCDASKHDADIKAGAVSLVCAILRSCSMFFKSRSKEIQHCLKILLNLFRCSTDRLCASFCTDGAALFLVLLEFIEINYRLGKKGDVKSLVLAQGVLDKLVAGARVPLSRIKLQEDLLSSLVGNISGATGSLVMHISLKVIASLSEHSQNKQAMYSFPGLMEAIALGSTYMFETVRDESARIIMNLSSDTNNKRPLIQHYMDVVLALARGTATSKSYAIHTLGSLSSLPENKVIMVQHKGGAVINVLLRVASSSTQPLDLRINATKILGNLAVAQVGSHPGLLVSLSSLAITDKMNQLAIMAAMSVKKLSNHIRSNDSCHGALLQALVTMSYGSSTEVLKWTVKAYCEQASSPTDRVSMIGHKGLLSSLTMLTNDENDFVRENARDVLSALAGKQ